MSQPKPDDAVEPPVIIEAATKLVPGVVQCKRCTNCWPKSEVQLNPNKPNYLLCKYCIGQQKSQILDKLIAKRAEELSQGLAADRGFATVGIAKVEEFIGALDLKMGGINRLAERMAQIIDGLMAKGAFATAGQLLLQLQKLRLSVQKQQHNEDFSQLTLKQKQDKLRVALLQMAAEYNMRVDQERLTQTIEQAMCSELEAVNELELELNDER